MNQQHYIMVIGFVVTFVLLGATALEVVETQDTLEKYNYLMETGGCQALIDELNGGRIIINPIRLPENISGIISPTNP